MQLKHHLWFHRVQFLLLFLVKGGGGNKILRKNRKGESVHCICVYSTNPLITLDFSNQMLKVSTVPKI